MTTAETAKALRQELKRHGYNSRKISVRCRDYSAIWVTINDLAIDSKEIEKIAHKFEVYQTDERTGEILCGGNLFVFVEYAYGLRKGA